MTYAYQSVERDEEKYFLFFQKHRENKNCEEMRKKTFQSLTKLSLKITETTLSYLRKCLPLTVTLLTIIHTHCRIFSLSPMKVYTIYLYYKQ